VNKYWPNDLRIDCKPFSNLVELTEIDGELKEGITKFERIYMKGMRFLKI
jgi:hypothetical protein